MTNRERVTAQLREMGKIETSYPDRSVSEEEIEVAKHFTNLARKNEQGTLSTKEAREVQELFEEDVFTQHAVIVQGQGKRWVEMEV